MTTDYNQIAIQYKKAKEQPWRTRIELFSMMNLIGDLRGKKVIDVACGEGWLTRHLRRAGRITGGRCRHLRRNDRACALARGT